jgi:hypothetical protein
VPGLAGGRRRAEDVPSVRMPTRAEHRVAPAPQGRAIGAAESLIAEVDALPAAVMAKRVGNDDVQAALETVGSAAWWIGVAAVDRLAPSSRSVVRPAKGGPILMSSPSGAR